LNWVRDRATFAEDKLNDQRSERAVGTACEWGPVTGEAACDKPAVGRTMAAWIPDSPPTGPFDFCEQHFELAGGTPWAAAKPEGASG
jgi:hypothetical protein